MDFPVTLKNLNIVGKMILPPPFPVFHVIFFPKALKFPSPLHNLKFFPKGLDEELYTPMFRIADIVANGHRNFFPYIKKKVYFFLSGTPV